MVYKSQNTINKNFPTAYEINFNHKIVLFDGHHTRLKTIFWRGYTFAQYTRWAWYFQYRYALLRVEYPKNRIDNICYQTELSDFQTKNLIKNKISSKKRKITILKNNLDDMVKKWSSLFSMDDDYKIIQFRMAIKQAEQELSLLLLQNN